MKATAVIRKADPVSADVNRPSGMSATIAKLGGAAVEVDPALDPTSSNPVENKAIVEALALKADLEDIPTAVSDLTNDSGFVNATQAASAAPVQSVNGQTGAVSLSIPTKTSQLTNDAGFINEKEAPVQTVNGFDGDVVLKAKDVGALPDTTVIPTATSQLTNDSRFITAATAPVRSVNGQTGAVTLSIPTVPSNVSAFTNDAGYVNASGAASASPVQSVNGQTGAVSLTIPTVPSAVSAFTNDAGYLTLSTLPIYQGGVSP